MMTLKVLKRSGGFAVCAVLVGLFLATPVRAAGIGFLPGPAGFDGSISNQDGSPDMQAGSHPYQVTTSFSLDTTTDPSGNPIVEGGFFKDLITEEPPGLIGDPEAVPVCPEIDFYTNDFGYPSCSNETAIGVLYVELGSQGNFSVPVYNVEPPPGVPAEFGAAFAETPILLRASVRSGSDYGVSISLIDNSQAKPITGATITIWGVPADPSHNPFRGRCLH